MRLFLDVGHGWHNRKPGVFDPGAPGKGLRSEAEVVRLVRDGVVAALDKEVLRAPEGFLSERARWQARALADDDVLLSLHMDASGTGLASGTSVFYARTRPELRPIAAEMSAAIAAGIGIPDRGAKPDTEAEVGKLAILRGHKQATLLLVELGFMDNPTDLAAVLLRGSTAVVGALGRFRERRTP